MGLEESILQARNFLEGASGVVNQGLGIFDQVASRFVITNDPGGEVGGQTPPIVPPGPAVPSPTGAASLIPLLAVGGLAYFLLR